MLKLCIAPISWMSLLIVQTDRLDDLCVNTFLFEDTCCLAGVYIKVRM